METSLLTCKTNEKTSFYMIGTSILKELKYHMKKLKTNVKDKNIPQRNCLKFHFARILCILANICDVLMENDGTMETELSN